MLTEALEDEDFDRVVDRRLERNYVAIEMFRMIEAAAACVRHSAARRPRMSLVIMHKWHIFNLLFLLERDL